MLTTSSDLGFLPAPPECRPPVASLMQGAAEAAPRVEKRLSCSACRGPVHRPYFQLHDATLCSGCLETMSVREMQALVNRRELRGTLHF